MLKFVAMREKEGPLETESKVNPRHTAAVHGSPGAYLVRTLIGYNRNKLNPEERGCRHAKVEHKGAVSVLPSEDT